MKADIQYCVDFIRQNNKKDISVYTASFLEKTFAKRMVKVSSDSLTSYLDYLTRAPGEIVLLLDSFHISHSLFFRNSLDMSIMEQYIFPELFQQRETANAPAIRVWSAGCAEGQEPYSLLMLAEGLISERFRNKTVMIFGTDISEKVLEKAKEGKYSYAAVQNVKLSFIDNYFTKTNKKYLVNDSIKDRADFSLYDLLDKTSATPPAGIYGNFNLISCCNLMIYYKPAIQKRILDKLYQSLAAKGYLMVDESEKSIVDTFKGLRPYTPLGNIYVKD